MHNVLISKCANRSQKPNLDVTQTWQLCVLNPNFRSLPVYYLYWNLLLCNCRDDMLPGPRKKSTFNLGKKCVVLLLAKHILYEICLLIVLNMKSCFLLCSCRKHSSSQRHVYWSTGGCTATSLVCNVLQGNSAPNTLTYTWSKIGKTYTLMDCNITITPKLSPFSLTLLVPLQWGQQAIATLQSHAIHICISIYLLM